ncbi:MAG: hypothetical protein M1831_004152 [Alyxoria varia]|nr:MAG: hypothetical protein M1831_004152 [Alyxoria varia]
MGDEKSTPQPRSGLSLYANLLDPSSNSSAAGTISSAPVRYNQAEDSGGASQQKAGDSATKASLNSALRFQPTKRPQQQAQKPKPRPAASRAAAAPSNNISAAGTDTTNTDANTTTKSLAAAFSSASTAPLQRPTLADFAGSDDEDLNEYYAGVDRARPERGGRRRKRKNNKEQGPAAQDWDDIYDPSRPNSYEEYKGSEERWREVREWKHRLYAHRMKRRRGSGSSDRSGGDIGRGVGAGGVGSRNNALFAPPPNLNDTGDARARSSNSPPAAADLPDDSTGDDAFARRMRMSGMPGTATATADEDEYSPPPAAESSAAPPPPAADVSDDPSGEDAYARRMRLSGMMPSEPAGPPPPPPTHQAPPPPPPPPPAESAATANPTAAAAISRAPVRYNLPSAPAEIPQDGEDVFKAQADSIQLDHPTEAEAEPEAEEETPRSSRPGQKGFAQRLLSKYGWSKGSGLGATGTGIATPLAVQVEKRKKKADAEGGGLVGSGSKGKIIGGKKAKGMQGKDVEGDGGGEQGEEKITRIVRLEGMCNGVDLDDAEELAGLVQEIGEECGEKYGNVERVRIDREGEHPVVLVEFTSPMSALRAVGALEGRMFAGSKISAGFAPEE